MSPSVGNVNMLDDGSSKAPTDSCLIAFRSKLKDVEVLVDFTANLSKDDRARAVIVFREMLTTLKGLAHEIEQPDSQLGIFTTISDLSRLYVKCQALDLTGPPYLKDVMKSLVPLYHEAITLAADESVIFSPWLVHLGLPSALQSLITPGNCPLPVVTGQRTDQSHSGPSTASEKPPVHPAPVTPSASHPNDASAILNAIKKTLPAFVVVFDKNA